MNKPISMIVKETQLKIASTCNESGLPPAILDLIIQGISAEIHVLAEKQFSEEKKIYEKSLEENKELDK